MRRVENQTESTKKAAFVLESIVGNEVNYINGIRTEEGTL